MKKVLSLAVALWLVQTSCVSAASFLRKTIGGQLKLRNAPELRFVYDDTLDRSVRVEETIRDFKKTEED